MSIICGTKWNKSEVIGIGGVTRAPELTRGRKHFFTERLTFLHDSLVLTHVGRRRNHSEILAQEAPTKVT